MLALVLTAFPSLTLPECAGGFIAAGFNPRKYDLYDTWFDENSTVTVAQAGVYRGTVHRRYLGVPAVLVLYLALHLRQRLALQRTKRPELR